jgi:hypothetical protein
VSLPLTATPHHHSAERIIVVGCAALAIAYAIVLAAALLQGEWLYDSSGRPIANDFVNVWAAGRFVLEGNAAGAYDWTLHKAAEVRAVGHYFQNYYGWHYPPTFLFVAAALALAPFMPAALLWLAITLPGYLLALRAIAGPRLGIALGLGFPAAVWNVTAGQNGFFTASLIGGTLTLMERSPALSGICLGLLTYKPQFGLLFPIVLIAGGRWRVIAFAALTATFMVALSLAAFGTAPWIEFIHGLSHTSRAVLGDGLADLDRMQSVFGLVRARGGGETLALSLQLAIAASIAAALCWLWRTQAQFEIKAAALATGTLLATPYVYMYDLVVLAVPVAFLIRGRVRDWRDRPQPLEIAALAAAAGLILSFPYAKTQVGLAAVLIVMGLIGARVVAKPAD